MAITKIPTIALSSEVVANLSADLKVTAITYPSGSGVANTGGDTIVLTGTNFDANLEIYINETLVSNINVANSSYLSFTSPNVAIGKYIIYVVNPDGKTAIVAPGLNAIEGYTFQGTVSGYTSGGAPGPTNVVDKFPFSSDTNATDVGDLTQARNSVAGQTSSASGYTSGGFTSTFVNTIDKFPFSSDGNAADVGDLTLGRYGLTGQSSSASGYTSGGTPPLTNTIDKFSFASDANATDVGDLTTTKRSAAGQSSMTNGYVSGGEITFPPSSPISSTNIIEKFPFASDANATDVGDISETRFQLTGQSSADNGYSSGGFAGTTVDTIDKFPFATDANATDVGNLTGANRLTAGQSSDASGYSSGGTPGASNVIDKFPFATNANATDVGDLSLARNGAAGQQV